MGAALPLVTRLDHAPHGLKEITRVYGDFTPYLRADGDVFGGWEVKTLAFVELPEPLPLSWLPDTTVARFRCNRAIVGNVTDVLEELHRKGLFGKSAPENAINSFGGCYIFRRQRNGKKPSLHCWGAAIDFDTSENAFGTGGNMSEEVVEVFRKHGWTWGGDFGVSDPMHFQFASGF